MDIIRGPYLTHDRYFHQDVAAIFTEDFCNKLLLFRAVGIGCVAAGLLYAIVMYTGDCFTLRLTVYILVHLLVLSSVAGIAGFLHRMPLGNPSDTSERAVITGYGKPGYEDITSAWDREERRFLCYTERSTVVPEEYYAYYMDDVWTYVYDNPPVIVRGPAEAIIRNSPLSCEEAFMFYSNMTHGQAERACVEKCVT